jgi:hypothetical protein
MRLIFVMILLLSNILSNAQCSELSILREAYVSSQSDMKSCKELDDLTKNCSPKLAPVEFSYNIISHLMQCNFIFNPFVKYTTFTKSTQQLDSMIYLNPQYTEIRFLRYLVQLNCPRFLGYRTNLENDYKIIMSSIKSVDEGLKNFILPIINNLDNVRASSIGK